MRRALSLSALLLPLLLALLVALTPRSAAAPTGPCGAGCINFVINVHDTGHVADSARTLDHLVDIYTRHGVKGELYLTGPMVELYAATEPALLRRLATSGMTISYHVRAPHPLVTGFDDRLRGLSDAQIEATLRDYETFGLDRATGELRRDRPGGYALVAQAMGQAPVTVVAPNSDTRVREAALRVYASLGAKAVVWYHERGTDLAAPLVRRQGLVVRPSDFSVTRWGAGAKAQFWWNRFTEDPAYVPLTYLQRQLRSWSAARPPFVTSLIHENNFYRDGAESWTLSYYGDKHKTTPLRPPFDLNPKEMSRPRSAADQAAIWSAYEDLVRWSAANLRVVTGAELAAMAP